MVKLHFRNVGDSPKGRTPVSLRIRLRRDERGAVLGPEVLFYYTGKAMSASDFAKYRDHGAWIETDSRRAYSQLLEVFGAGSPVKLITPSTDE